MVCTHAALLDLGHTLSILENGSLVISPELGPYMRVSYAHVR